MNDFSNIAKFAAMCYDILHRGLTITSGSITVSGTITETNSSAILTAANALAGAINGAADALKVELVGTSGVPINITAGDLNVSLSDRGTDPSSIRIGNGTNLLNVNADGSLNVAATLVGGATAVNQTNGSQRTQVVDGIGNIISSTGNALDVNVKSGMSNYATETGGNLASINTKTPALGQALASGSTPVVLPVSQITTLTPPAAITNYAQETGGNLAAIKADVDKIPSQGQALASASMPVVLTALQLATLTPTNSPLDKYKIQDQDASGTVKYYGFAFASGQYYLLKQDTTTSTPTYRYANVGNNGTYTTYTSAWTGRAALTYDYLFNLTGL